MYDRTRMLNALQSAGFRFDERTGRWRRDQDGAELQETALAGSLYQAQRMAEEFIYEAVQRGKNPTCNAHSDQNMLVLVLRRT